MVRRQRITDWLRLAGSLRYAGRGVLAATALLTLLAGLLPTAFLVAMGRVAHDLTAAPPSDGLSGWMARAGTDLIFAFAALALQQLVPPFFDAVTALTTRRIDQRAVTGLLRAAMRAPVQRVEQPQAVSVLSELSDAVARNSPMPGAAAAVLPRLSARYLQLAGAIVVVGYMISWLVGFLLLVGALIIRFGQRGALARFVAEWLELGPARQRMNYLQGLGTELAAAKEMRVFGMLPWLRNRYGTEADAYYSQFWRRRRAVYFRPFLGYTAIGFAIAVTAFVLLTQLYSLSAGVVVLAVAVQAVLVPLRFGIYFPECDEQTQYGMQHQAQIREYQELVRPQSPTAAPESGAATLTPAVPHEISFRDVHFRYPDTSRDVLRGLDLVLPAGRSTALVGVNGAGKTTLVRLLAGVYQPTSGAVTVDGADLRDLDPVDWRRQVAVIFQNFLRFEVSLRENLLFGATHLPEDRDAMMEALTRANAHDVLKGLPRGLDTVLSPEYSGGTGLSGGQWQRVALARAYYAVNRGARVLVLDEPTAQLDVRSEIDFYERFLEFTQGLTTLVISHRFSTVRRADAIAVLDGGGITEYGSHELLLERNGGYAAMFRTQADRFAGAAGRQR